MALGAQRQRMLAMVVQGMVQVTIGLAVGLAGAIAFGRVLRGLLLEVQPSDPITFTTALLALAAEPFTLAFGVDGNLKFPDTYREWVFVDSTTGLAYGETSATRRRGYRYGQNHPGMFTQGYLEPGAYHHFRQTGQFKEGTAFALEMRQPTTGVSIARDGWFAEDLQGIHAAIKDTERFGGWAYFNVDTSGVTRRVRTPACDACHAKHSELDNVYVQFYPPLTGAVRLTGQ